MSLNIGYFADGPWSHLAFNKLIQDKNIKISFICARFDTRDETLKNYCKQYDIDFIKHKNINSREFIENVTRFKCDLFVSMSFNQIFKSAIINLATFGFINCHAGKLPFYRGRNILNWALINDEDEFGITVHYIDEGIDTGDIILQRTFPISDKDDYSTLLQVSYVECANILYDAVILLKGKSVERIKQNSIHPVGFYCSQRKMGDEILNWNKLSREIFNFVRAICHPGPMARSYVNGKEIKINKVEMVESAPSYQCIEGAILNMDDDGFYVKTRDNFIKVVEYEIDGTLRIGDRFEIK